MDHNLNFAQIQMIVECAYELGKKHGYNEAISDALAKLKAKR